jgi:lipoprotein signal peptidase
MRTWRHPWLTTILCVVALLSDILTKALVFGRGPHADQFAGDDLVLYLRVQWRDWSWIEPAVNKGVAWSMFAQFPSAVALMTVLLVPAIAVWYWRSYRSSPRLTEHLAFALILGGAIGNKWDRLASLLPGDRIGGVRDFLHVDLNRIGIDYIWPTFNLADSWICIGAGLLFLGAWMTPQRPVVAEPLAATPADPGLTTTPQASDVSGVEERPSS